MQPKKYFISTLLLAFILVADNSLAQKASLVSTLSQQNQWVDSVYNKLNRRQRIGQLFFVRAHTNRGQAYSDSVGKVIKKEHVGGLVFFQGGPGRQANLVNEYQKISRIPLLIAMDGEWGWACGWILPYHTPTK
jgi:beta-N-acetylhexosaminidase